MNRVYISGVGMTSAIGSSLEESWNSITQGKTGIRHHEYTIGEKTRTALLATESFDNDANRLYDLAQTSILQSIDHSGLSTNEVKSSSLIFAHGGPNSVLLSSEFKRHAKSFRIRPDTVYRGMNNHLVSRLAAEHGITGRVLSVSAACSGSAQAIDLGFNLIQHGVSDVCICGGAEAIDHFIYDAFVAMKCVLAPKLSSATAKVVQPFGTDRKGIVLGEAGGAVVLESEEHLLRRRGEACAELVCSRSENVPDATYGDISDHTRWCNLLENTAEDIEKVQYVVAHATSTQLGDRSEGLALIESLPQAYVSSFKYYLGHTLSASTVIDLSIITKCIQESCILPIGEHVQIDDKLAGLRTTDKTVNTKLTDVIKLSAGFGGSINFLHISSV